MKMKHKNENENTCRYCGKVIKGLINTCDCIQKLENKKLWSGSIRKKSRVKLTQR